MGVHYARIFCVFFENNYLALPCTYQKCHQGQRHTFKTSLKQGAPRRLDYIAIPKTWLAASAKSLVLQHFDAYTIIYDHKPVAVEIKVSLMSRKVLTTIPRLDNRWIQSRCKKTSDKLYITQTCSRSRICHLSNTSTGMN